ncbi:MAG: TonB-dependent receptor [Acidobacteria bacterium]|uniref:TonB-dependent receptor n=1 Tax=Candidatus Polarisedimenticola svalbardensis TaxID=2886004 RepID=A0A8J6Y2H5_9BACT|nr:TonB-dependent receptor [Candidatus Polarisedimenticola svalbardensis]
MNHRNSLLMFCIPILILCLPVHADDPLKTDHVEKVVVTAHRDEIPEDQVGSSITVITAEDLERAGKTMVLDALRSVPGLEVARNGGPGGTASVFMRGANAEHTLVLVDGVEVNDPIAPTRAFDFGNLAVNNIDRIEILRGPQSTLYGSDALVGVIHIITKKGGGELSGYLSAEGGSFSTTRATAGIHGGGDRTWYSIGITDLDTDGISAAADTAGNSEEDSYSNRSLSARLGHQAGKNLTLDLILTAAGTDTDLDNFGGAFGDDPNSIGTSEQFAARAEGRLTLLEGDWNQTFGIALTDYDRSFDNPVDAGHPVDLSSSSYRSRLVKLDWQNQLRVDENHNLVFGLEAEEEEGDSEYYSDGMFGPFTDLFSRQSARTTGLFLQDHMTMGDSLFATFGFRVDDHTRFGSEATFRGAFSWKAGDRGTRIKGSFGTGFKAPSLFQLYSSFGSTNLSPEESAGWDAGIEQRLADGKVILGATWFRNDFDNLIQFDGGSFTYANIARAETRGIEFTAAASPSDRIDLVFGYTWTDTEDRGSGEELLRRPGSKLSLAAHYQVTSGLGLNLDLVQVGARDDLDFASFPAARVELPDYTLLNLAAGWQASPRVRIHARIENVLDEEYQEVLGYGAPGLGAYAGVKLTL